MKWFKHMTATWDDEKIARMVDAGGKDGLALYGAWWRVSEIVASQIASGGTVASVTYSVTRWSVLMSVRGSHVSHYLGQLAKNGLVTMEWIDSDIRVTIPNLLKYRDEYARKSGHKQESVPPRTEVEGEGEAEKEKEQEQQPSEAPSGARSPKPAKPKPEPDPKHGEFRLAFRAYFLHKNPSLKAEPWDAQEAANLTRFLKKNPQFTTEQWKTLLTHRARSPVGHGESLSAWIARAFTWLDGPTDKFGNKAHPGVSNGKSAIEQSIDLGADILEERRRARSMANGADRGGGGLEAGHASFEPPSQGNRLELVLRAV